MPDKPNAARASETTPSETATVLDRMLGGRRESGETGSLADGEVVTWAETHGTLADGRAVRLGASCLLRPAPGDRVLVWSGEDGTRWILSVLKRREEEPAVVATPGPLTIKASRVAMTAPAVHIHAEDFLTSARNRHAVEELRTESVQTRVAQIGTDIRRASHASDEVEGTVLQRAGMWISNTLREARLHAKAFMFD